MMGNTHLRVIGRALTALSLFLFLGVFCCLLTSPVSAQQFDTGTITGTVTDSSGAVIPHATITVTNIGTSAKKTYQTDDNGRFVASALPFGNYEVSATAANFGEAKTKTIVLNVGAAVHVALALSIQTTTREIEVTGTATSVDTQTATSGTTLDANQISNLPVNGRDVGGFLNIAPGSVNSAPTFQGSVNGLENVYTGLNITVDGQNASRGDINGFLDTEGQEGARVTRSSLDSIQEIDFSNNGYSADNGHSLGPQMNIITKSGTNTYHGTLFEFLRNDALDARDYFENGKKQPLRLNQFGGNLSGPIIKNKLFFFVNYEGDRTHITNFNSLYEVPSALVRSKMNSAMQPVLAQMAPLPAGCTSIPAPASCAVPGTDEVGPDGKTPTGGGAQLVYDPAALSDTVREDTGSLRLDYDISDRDRLMFRYNINDSNTEHTYGLNVGQVSPQSLRTQLGKIEETHTFSTTLLNQFSVAYNRFYSDTNSDTPTPLVGFAGFFTNLGALPGPNTFNQITPFNVFELSDNVIKTMGSHTLHFGTQIRANRLNEWLRPQQTYDFASFSDLENDNPFVLQKIGFPGFLGVRNSNWDFFVQDDWRVTQRLTINLGLRYDYNTTWGEQHDREQNFDFATQSFLPTTQPVYNAPKTDFAPRVGFSWDPFGKGKTVIHGYGGIFYMPMHFGFGMTGNIPEYSSYNVNVFQALFGNPPFSIAYPSPTPALPAGTQNVNIFPRNPSDPSSTNWLFGIQQELAPNTILRVDYTGNKTQHMQAGVDFAGINLNPANIVTQARQYSGFANETLDSDSLSSNYNALQVQLRRNIGNLSLEANYTWAHEIDDMVNALSGGFSDPFDPSVDRGSGDWDVRHNFTASAVYSLPELKGSSTALRETLGGWQTSSILQVRSGLPTNITLISGLFGNPMRPNYVSGQPLWVSNGSWPTASYNINAFEVPAGYDGTWGANLGDVGRNSLRGPAFFQWDLSMAKNFAITEATKLQFRADIFNILNHPNFSTPDGGICTAVTGASGTTPAGCTINPNFGVTGQTVADANGSQIGNGTARQVQLSLKFIF